MTSNDLAALLNFSRRLSGLMRYNQLYSYGLWGVSPGINSLIEEVGCCLFQWRVQFELSDLPHWAHTLNLCAGSILFRRLIRNYYKSKFD
jgi:hypothetical protein